ncbi:MAG: tRNA (adenosine(37)-N6)-threonylcarbamoyltransferase complex dimerization subunit type 1 TsaB, partial [Balneolaceae bacterium]|nr:tRNA (adenosine(37)-N6)-threonylcarbamoyltransferase complex dimerization subunit type 1 TsaB [Balneolaceae bacterium]
MALRDEEGEILERRTEQRGRHSEQLFIFIRQFMESEGMRIPNLQAVLISEGPGSYTGLRIGASAVKGLLFQTGVPLYAVNTLAGFALSAFRESTGLKKIHSVIDARRRHLYHQEFEMADGQLLNITEVEILTIETVQSMVKSGEGLIGTGIDRLNSELLAEVRIFETRHIGAESLIHLFESGTSRFVQERDP